MSEVDFHELSEEWKIRADLFLESHDAMLSHIEQQTEELHSLREELARVREALNKIGNTEIFSDGLASDLRGEGVTNVAQAYMEGRQDCIREINEALTTEDSKAALEVGDE